MTRPAISVRDLVKDYPIYAKPSDLLVELVTRRPQHVVHRALNGVTFDVARGEVVGIIGRNGAGKSTLLKVLTGILEPDGGSVEVNGRTAAILELGTGLNPEYSGRDNVFFGQVCRGLSPREARARMDEIIAFAELDSVIDRPFKTYSSGMQARLLFATSIHVDSEILIIDEALAAGDILFQEKCFRKMREIARSGRAVLFVSHGLDLVQQLCHRAILMHAGEILLAGDTGEVTKAYYDLAAQLRNDAARGLPVEKSADEARAIVAASGERQHRARISDKSVDEVETPQPSSRVAVTTTTAAASTDAAPFPRHDIGSVEEHLGLSPMPPQTHTAAETSSRIAPLSVLQEDPVADARESKSKIELLSVSILNDRLEETDALEYGSDFHISAHFLSDTDIPHLIAGMEIRLPTGFLIFTVQNTLRNIDFGCRANEPFELRWRIRNTFQNGTYFVGVGIGEVFYSTRQGLRHSPFTILAQELNAQIFNVVSAPEFAGIIDLKPEFKILTKAEDRFNAAIAD
ncbi:ATP-binding cassette domain-containing protein [Aliihoeflea aestuarii]|nr:ABC transporter ATP-binding protein [Aliihoeflea aestuarii]MCO6390173.1 ATP-binding cassette domain-containing protein [Aliihoeflea aestuarii]